MNDPQNTFGLRLKSARLKNGFSLQELANRLQGKLTRQSLHRYEKGEVVPDSETMGWLSEALDVRPDFFSRNVAVTFDCIEYRKLKNMPQKEENKVIEQTREYLERYLELEEIIGLSMKFENYLEKLEPVKEYADANEAARVLRSKWKLGNDPIYNIVALLEDKHIKVVAIQADGKFDGLQTWVNGSIPVVAYNAQKIEKPDRIRFTLLHELGHLLLKFDKGLTSNDIEKLCHQFAAAMLLPEPAIETELGKHRTRLSFQELGLIKRQYGISMHAIVMRAKDCGIINSHYAKQLFMIMASQGWKKDEPYEYTGEEQSHRFDQLLMRALAEEQITLSKAAALKNERLTSFKDSDLFL